MLNATHIQRKQKLDMAYKRLQNQGQGHIKK